MKNSVLTMENVDVRIGDKMVLQNLNIQVNQGDFVGVIGPNGAGKTTFLRVVLGLIPAWRGEVQINGNPLTRGDKTLAYVPQKIQFEPDTPLRARDLVGLGLDGHRWGIPLFNKKRREQIDEVLEAVNALHYADKAIGRLSGGEQQRLLIAQALLSQPKLLLLDEPLANLDIKSANEVVKWLEKIGRERKITILLVTHDVNPLLGVMDQVLYLAKGRAIMGQPDVVIQKDVLTSLYGYEVDVLRIKGRVLVVAGQEDGKYGLAEGVYTS